MNGMTVSELSQSLASATLPLVIDVRRHEGQDELHTWNPTAYA